VKKTWLVVGLGNPEGKYFQTYHNVGFLAADALAARLNLQFKKKGNQLLAQCTINNEQCIILKPLTYMNLSGQAVLAVARKYKIAPENIIVFTDDLYIDKNNIRITLGGSHAGHNGIHSINDLLKTNQYIKIRIGIRTSQSENLASLRSVRTPLRENLAPLRSVKSEKPLKSTTADYVLSKIDKDSRPQIDHAIEKAVNVAMSLIGGETISKMQNLYNTVNTDAQNPQ